MFVCWRDRRPYDENTYLAALKRRGSPLNAKLQCGKYWGQGANLDNNYLTSVRNVRRAFGNCGFSRAAEARLNC